MNKLLHTLTLGAIWLLMNPAIASPINDKIEFGDYIENNKAHLYNIPNIQLDFAKTPIDQIVDVLAKCSGINYQLDELNLPNITTKIRMNPFKALELMTEHNGLTLREKAGIWFIGYPDNSNLYQKTYVLKNIHLETILNSTQGHESTNKTAKYEGSGTPKASNMVESINKSKAIKKEQKSPLEKHIHSIISLGNDKDLLHKSLVTYDPDSNRLYVIATEKQHYWIENYLSTIDQNIPNIEIKIMFVASSQAPEERLGINWSGMLSEGYSASAGDVNSDGKSTGLNWGSISNIALPSAIIRSDDLNIKLNALYKNNEIDTKRYPTLTGYSNREVVINFTQNEPVVSTTSNTEVSTSTNNIGSGVTNTVSITQEQVGTIVRLLPRIIHGNKISLDIDIGVSNILGFKSLKGNDYPIISQTRYQGQTTVESGYTIVVGGLEETISENVETGIPFLRRMPFFGWLFKDIKKKDKTQKLSLYISVRLLDSQGETLSAEYFAENEGLLKSSIDQINQKVLELSKKLS